MAADVPSCHVENAKAAKLSLSPSQMCQCFQRRLAGEVGDDRLKAVCDVQAKEAVSLSDSTDA